MKATIARFRNDLDQRNKRLAFLSPQQRIQSHRQLVDENIRRLETNTRHLLEIQKLHLQQLAGNLAAVNPLAILARGFAIVSKTDGALVRSVHLVQPGDLLEVRVQDGNFKATVT
jgi:exodeoxyribonuclease VII large subunit